MLGLIDYLVMVTYLALLVVIGVRALKAQGSPDEYFLGGRSIKTASLTVLWFASWIGGASLVATVNRAYTLGISAVWYVTALGVGCILFGLLFAARVKRLAHSHQFLTYPELIESAFDGRTRIIATITTILSFMAYAGGQLAAAAAVIAMLLDLTFEMALALTSLVVVSYTALGGFKGITQTDWIQALLIFFGLIFIGLPIAYSNGGTIDQFHERLPLSFFDIGGWGWAIIIPMALSIILSFFVAMDGFTRSYAASSEATARRAPIIAGLLILPMGIIAVWIGMTAVMVLPDSGGEGDVLTAFVVTFFPEGLKGLMLCGILAAIMSTADICILTASGNVTHDLYQRLIAPKASPAQLLRVSMAASAVIGIMASLLAWQMRDVIDILVLGFTINAAALLLPTLWAVFQWQGYSTASFYSAITGLVVVVCCKFLEPQLPDHPFFADPLWPGLSSAMIIFITLHLLIRTKQAPSSGTPV